MYSVQICDLSNRALQKIFLRTATYGATFNASDVYVHVTEWRWQSLSECSLWFFRIMQAYPHFRLASPLPFHRSNIHSPCRVIFNMSGLTITFRMRIFLLVLQDIEFNMRHVGVISPPPSTSATFALAQIRDRLFVNRRCVKIQTVRREWM